MPYMDPMGTVIDLKINKRNRNKRWFGSMFFLFQQRHVQVNQPLVFFGVVIDLKS